MIGFLMAVLFYMTETAGNFLCCSDDIISADLKNIVEGGVNGGHRASDCRQCGVIGTEYGGRHTDDAVSEFLSVEGISALSYLPKLGSERIGIHYGVGSPPGTGQLEIFFNIFI